MKSLNKKEFKISGVKLFLDDLDKIVEIISSNSKVVEIFDSDFMYDSIADLANNRKKRVRRLNLVGHDPYISFEYNCAKFNSMDFGFAGEIKLSAFQDADLSFLKIKEILGQKKRWYYFLVAHQSFSMFLFLLYIIYILYITIKFGSPEWISVLDIFILIVVYSSIFLGVMGYLTSINLVYSHQGQSLLVRRKDDLSIAIIGSIISAIIGATIVLAFGK